MVAKRPEALVERVGRSALWTLLGFGGAQALRFGSNLVLTRLLLPEAFGVMVLVNTFLLGMALFSDVGINTSVIQNKRGAEPTFLDTAWTLSVVRGLALAIAASLLAVPMSRFYGEPALATLIPAASIAVVFQSASSMRMVIANRQLHLRRVTAVELASQAVGIAVTIGLASAWPSVWALVIGSVSGAGVRCALTFVAFEGRRERFRWDRGVVLEIFRVGRWIFISTALMFVANHLDRFVFGKLGTLETLGLYNQATQLASISASAVMHLNANVVFPLFADVVSRNGDAARVFARARPPILVAGGWLTSVIIVGGPAIVTILYPPVYAPAGAMLQLIAAASWFGLVLEGSNGAMLLAHGHTKWVAFGSLAKAIILAPALFVGWSIGESVWSVHGGVFGALMGLVVADVAKYVVSVLAIGRLGLARPRVDLALTLMVFASSVVGWIAAHELTVLCEAPASLLIDVVLGATRERINALTTGLFTGLVMTMLWLPLLRWALQRWHERGKADA